MNWYGWVVSYIHKHTFPYIYKEKKKFMSLDLFPPLTVVVLVVHRKMFYFVGLVTSPFQTHAQMF